jgi:CPA2 family monovalent cation:H+ antiporter-2
MMTNSVIGLALILLSAEFLLPIITANVVDGVVGSLVTSFITLIAIAPFLWALAIKKMQSRSFANLWLDKKYNHGPLVMLEVLRNVLLVLLVGFMVDRLFNAMVAVLAILPVIVLVLLVFSRRLQSFYSRIEKRFLTNLNQREDLPATGSDLSPWDAHLAYFVIPPESRFIGKTLLELAWREQFGINIAAITRGQRKINTPARTDVIYPHDEIAVIGTDIQLEKFRKLLDPGTMTVDPMPEAEDVTLNKLIIDNHTGFRGLSIRASGIREMTNGLVVGIERNGERILNPDSTTVFEWDDVVWIVGDRKKIQDLVKE